MIRSSVLSMEAYVPGEQPRLPDLVKLNTNENAYPPSPAVGEALARIAPADLRLYPDATCAPLRARIAEIHGCDPDQVFVGNGSDEVLRLCTDAFVENDGVIASFDPSYSLYPVLAAMRDVPCRLVTLDDGLRWPADGAVLGPGADASLFFLTNPNAPTGRQYDKAQVRAFCERAKGVVVIDEAYVDFAEGHCMDLALSLPNVLVSRTLSKSFSLAGLRIGYIVGPRPLVAALHKLKDSYNVDRIAQALALAALNDLDWMRANVRRIVATRARLAAALRGLGWEVADSQTNFLWCRPAPLDADAVFAFLREHAIIVRHWTAPPLRPFLRITVGTDEQIDRLLAVLETLRH